MWEISPFQFQMLPAPIHTQDHANLLKYKRHLLWRFGAGQVVLCVCQRQLVFCGWWPYLGSSRRACWVYVGLHVQVEVRFVGQHLVSVA